MGVVRTSLGSVGADVRGTGGIPLLFLHGVGSDRTGWAPQLEHFGRSRTTIALDHPGYGDSDFQPHADRTAFAATALALLDALGIERAHVCGLSLGGVVALAMHGLAPDRLASLVIADSFACHPEGQAILDRSLAGARELGMRGLAEARVPSLLAQPADPALVDALVDTMARIDPAAYALAAEAVWLADQRREAARVACPALILCGTQDRITPPYLSEELKIVMAHAGLIEISGAGHLSNLEQPAVFNRIVEAFLSEVEEEV